jgi:phosphoenolpyruvate carboxykinase (ATP)
MVGTEMGVTEPTAVFSSCYGEPFLMWHPLKYAEMLADKLAHHGAHAWLLNTGWIGSTGKRCPLKYTRAIIDAIHSGELAKVECAKEQVFGLHYPLRCTHVPSNILNPATSWDDRAKYEDAQAKLASAFVDNFSRKGFASAVGTDVLAQAPRVLEGYAPKPSVTNVGPRAATGGAAA